MNRTITIKGTGKVSLKPDLTVISMTLRSLDKDYDMSMRKASDMLERLKKELESVGYKKEDLKTTNFNVCTEHENVRDSTGNYKKVFAGYACIQGLKLEFDFDTVTLSKILTAISRCVAAPDLSVRFTVRDKEAASEALLKSASVNAKKKAEILTAASGVKLGELLSIDYNWGELDLYSRTDYRKEAKCMAMDCAVNIGVEPENIELDDTVTFTWQIE